MFEYRTQGFNGYAVKYSPFYDSRLAVAASANFGLVGNGRLYILGLTPNGIVAEKWFDTQDALFDVSWSEAHENQVVVAAGDGSIKLFDIGLDNFPVQSWQEHKREVFAVSWNLVGKDTFCSSSWDGCIKIWSPHREESLLTLPTHSCTYSAQYSPHNPSVLCAVSSDARLRIYDLRLPASVNNHLAFSTLLYHRDNHSTRPPGTQGPAEALTHDWNKYRDSYVAAAGVDRVIRTYDVRQGKGPLALMDGHEYAIRKVAWSPHAEDLLLSASYDMTCRLWRDPWGSEERRAKVLSGVGRVREAGRMERHTEFVVGVDWCLFGAEGWCASCGWDERVLVWDAKGFITGR